jgi:hypothetical protein
MPVLGKYHHEESMVIMDDGLRVPKEALDLAETPRMLPDIVESCRYALRM